MAKGFMRLMKAALLAWAAATCEAAAGNKMLIGYFPNWLYANYPVEQIPYDQYTHINYAFAILNSPDRLPSFTDDWAVESGLPKIVENAHKVNTKVLLSIGGWTGSQRFSSMVADPASRKQFIDWNLDFIEKYGTDGVDIDWEYPGRQAAGCNEFAPADTENFQTLLKELRASLDERFPNEHKEISMAVHVDPFVGTDGQPVADVSGFVPYFDRINLMTYDINGAWASTTGPNAPFRHEQGKGAPYSFVQSIQAWKNAGVPADKITAGIAFYGRSMQAEVDMMRDQYQPSKVGAPKGDSDDAYWADPYCAADTAGVSGIWKWRNLRSEGVLDDDFETAGNGWQRFWDDTTQTPWLFNAQSKIFVSYDDPKSIDIKVDHALCEDLAGLMVWDIHQDNGELLKAASKIRTAERPAVCPLEKLQQQSKSTAAAAALSSAIASSVASASAAADAVYAFQPSALSNIAYPSATMQPFEFLASASAAPSVPVSAAGAPAVMDEKAGSAAASAAATPSSSVADFNPMSRLVLHHNGYERHNKGGEHYFKAEHDKDDAPSMRYSKDHHGHDDGDDDYDDDSCTNGHQRCEDSGSSPSWLTCNQGQWITRSCTAGTVCFDGHGSITCDYPR